MGGCSVSKICLICIRKSDRNVTANQIKELKKYSSIFDKISPEDPRVPTGICGDCRLLLQLKINKKGQDKEFKVPSGFSFQSDVIIPKTRSSDCVPCNCLICERAEFKGKLQPLNQPTAQTQSNKKDREYSCPKCFTLIGKRISHICNDSSALENL